VVWTAPFGGSAAITGVVWNARNIGRPQTWQVLVNGVVFKSGSLPGNGTITRAHPTTFTLPTKTLFVGEKVELLIFKSSTSSFGDFVGADIMIKLTH